MKITLLGGVKEIGGNKILLEHKDTRIFLDFGMSFNQSSKYFSEFLQPRKCSAIEDFFELGLLPDMEGIYREDYLKHMSRPVEKRKIDAVFLTHAHADHSQFIHFLRFDIPIYCTEATRIILKALEETGSSTFSDFVTACETFTFYKNSKGNLCRASRRNENFIHRRKFMIMGTESKVRIGSLEIEMIPVDHSLPGACGYIIYSDEGNLVYTGDIRFHGSNQEYSRKFVDRAKKVRPKWLLSEGTRIDSDKKETEAGVKEKIKNFISGASGLVFVEHPIRDIDRVNTIFESSRENGREFVVNLKLAYLINALGSLCPFSLEDVKVLVPKKSWGLVDKKGIEARQVDLDYDSWERKYIKRENSITCREISKNPQRYVVSMSMWEINQLIDIKPKGAIWIKSSCEPFCEEMELDEERKKNWLKHFEIKEFYAHASGHAAGDEIKKMVKEIGAENVIPIHTEHPEMF